MDVNEGMGFNRLSDIYLEAKKSNCFIFDKNRKTWYTPEQFREKHEQEISEKWLLDSFLDDFVVLDPLIKLNSGQKQLIEKIDNFRNEIIKELAKLSEL